MAAGARPPSDDSTETFMSPAGGSDVPPDDSDSSGDDEDSDEEESEDEGEGGEGG